MATTIIKYHINVWLKLRQVTIPQISQSKQLSFGNRIFIVEYSTSDDQTTPEWLYFKNAISLKHEKKKKLMLASAKWSQVG